MSFVTEINKSAGIEHRDLWQPLQGPKAFRLLRLLSGAANETVAVELIHDYTADSVGLYDALSYVKTRMIRQGHVRLIRRSDPAASGPTL